MTAEERLKLIAEILYGVVVRCFAFEGASKKTVQEIRQDELSEICILAAVENVKKEDLNGHARPAGAGARRKQPPAGEQLIKANKEIMLLREMMGVFLSDLLRLR